ncbi:sodium:solute symporter family protein [Neolewinella antarctica]|uniref:Na+/proline symporter n=1 Tax=Neolewinella antarctica TaxID=442734 RepID=A0ABX0XGF0_9BACT|nr:sodium:solute symporter family protein [Neolewinella antarctica]NJC28235.1 Na+/proline symporter [Neolewinella antarctica]
MQLHLIDVLIILGYLILTIGIGFWISKKASKNIKSYFLGGNEIKWYYLGLSNASGMFDISGTMWMVMLLFVYGLKSVWIPWLWPVFNQIFMMIFLSVWLRRSGVMTGAEWIKFRFGDGKGANLAHIVVVLFAVIVVITYVAYGFIGIGKFASAFLPLELSSVPATNEMYYGLIFTFFTAIYVIKGGMYSVVFTEVLQYVIMTIASIAIGVIAMQQVSPEMLAEFIPTNWDNIFFSWKLDLDWTGIMDSVNDKIKDDGWEMFGIFITMVLLKGVLQSLAGPAPSYDMQRVLSTRSPKEAAKMSGFVNLVLLFPRYMLIAGLTVLALVFYSDELNQMGDQVDFEQILPFAIKNFVPVGLLGILIAGLLAAFMSSFAASVNAAPAYIVNDIYKRYINSNATDKQYINMSYLASAAVVIVGTLFAFMLDSLNNIIDWLVAALYGGYTAANVLKWYWWRFNGFGYFAGMVAGILAAMILPYALPEYSALEAFPINFGFSLTACIAVSFLTEPDDVEVLKNFYLRTRPWGFWKPIHNELLSKYPNLEKNNDFGRDMLNVAVGIIWQVAITAAPIFMIIRQWDSFLISMGVAILCTVILKYNWYDKLEDYPVEVRDSIPE